MKNVALAILLSQVACLPIYLIAYVSRKDKEREAAMSAQENAQKDLLEQERKQDESNIKRTLYDALRGLQRQGAGAPYITAAIRTSGITRLAALNAVRFAKKEAEKWSDDSTPDAVRHWRLLSSIYDDAVDKLMEGEG